jgi:transposase-like protein
MPRKTARSEELVAKLRQVDLPLSQGKPAVEAVRAIGVREATYDRWRREFGGLKADQVRRLKDSEAENARLRRAVSDLTVEKLILKEAARGSFQAPPAAVLAWGKLPRNSGCPNAWRVGFWRSTARRSARRRRRRMTRRH